MELYRTVVILYEHWCVVMSSKREQIIEVTGQLMGIQGLHATGLNEIFAESGAPKGSLYYYFPDGKDELAATAIKRTGKIVAERIRDNVSTTDAAGTAIQVFVRSIANAIGVSGYQAGGPLMAMAMETATTNDQLNLDCREDFGQILHAFADRLTELSYPSTRATELANFITAAIEGGIILSRVQHSGTPLRRVADELDAILSNANS